MDILSARKKAAERARALKEAAAETPAIAPAPAEQQPPEQGAQPLPPSGDVPVDAAAAEEAATADAGEASAIDNEAEKAPERAPDIEMLAFSLGEEEYAVPVDVVKEVLKNRDLTLVPNAPDYVLGVMALRGPVLPVIDLCKRLGLPPGRNNEKTRIIVVSVNEEDAGIQVDRVTGVVKIPPEAIRPTPETIEHGAELLRGIARKDEKLYILLDIEKAISQG